MTVTRTQRSQTWQALLALGLAIGLLFVLTGAAAGYQVVSDTGDIGAYVVLDSGDDEGAKCGYGPEDGGGVADFKWMKVFAPQVWARDVSGVRDNQTVSWRVNLFRSIDEGPWQSIRTSAWQSKNAFDDQPAAFAPIKVYYTGSANERLQAQLTIRWHRNGTVEGKLKLLIDLYQVKWTVGTPDFIWVGACAGSAD